MVSSEILGVERENVHNAIHRHCGNKAGVVSLFARNAVRDNESSPFGVDIVGIGQTRDRIFNTRHDTITLAWAEAEAVAFQGARANGPQFNEVLGADTDAIAIRAEPDLLRHALGGEDNVRIGKDVHYRFHSSSRV